MKHTPPFGRFCVLKRKENRQLLIPMADAIGISPAKLSSAELGERTPEIDWLPKIRAFLKLSEFEARRLEKIVQDLAVSSSHSDQEEAFESAAFKVGTKKEQENPE